MSHDVHPHLKRFNIMDVLQDPLEKNHVNHSACISNACQDEHPLVSVVIPTFNRSAALSLAIASVQNQTFGNLEIQIVDDGSTQDTASRIR